MKDPALIERITRSLAFMLRHQPERFDLELDEHGFADLEDTVRALNEKLGEPVEAEDVVEAVQSGDRQRYEVEGDRIRALYGHSIPVEPGPAAKPPETLYVAIPTDALRRAQRFGLRGGRRSFLHLALTMEDACDSGRRLSPEYTVLRIRALDAWEEGVNFYDRRSLWLADEIPTHLLEIEGSYEDGEEPLRRGSRPRPRGRGRGRGRDDRRRDDDERRPRRARSEWDDEPDEPDEPDESDADEEPEREEPTEREPAYARRGDDRREADEAGREPREVGRSGSDVEGDRARDDRARGRDRGGRDRDRDRGRDRGRGHGRGRDGDRGGPRERDERAERDRGDRSRGDRDRGDRNRGDRNRGDRDRGDRDRGDRDRGDRDRGDRNRGDRERPSERPRRDREREPERSRPREDSPSRPREEPRRVAAKRPTSPGPSFGAGIFEGAAREEVQPVPPPPRSAPPAPVRTEAPARREEPAEGRGGGEGSGGFGAGLEG